MILEVADTAPIQSPHMKSAGNWRIAGECIPSACWMMEDTVGTVPTRSESSTRKAGGEESSRFTRQINTVLGQPSSIS